MQGRLGMETVAQPRWGRQETLAPKGATVSPTRPGASPTRDHSTCVMSPQQAFVYINEAPPHLLPHQAALPLQLNYKLTP